MSKNRALSLGVVALLQAFGLIMFCSLMGSVLFMGNTWFKRVPEYLAPLIMLTLLSTSALICGLITISYPAILFFAKKRPKEAMKLLIYTVLDLIIFIAMFIGGNLWVNR